MRFVKIYNIYKFAPSSLNSFGVTKVGGNENTIVLKRIGGRIYISGQAYRYWLRSTLELVKKHENWIYDTVNREEEVIKDKVIDVEKIVDYPGFDLFGYMITKGKRGSSDNSKDNSITRASVVKTSVVLGIDAKVTRDVITRRGEKDKNSLAYRELATGTFYNVVEVELFRLGKYTGEELTGDYKKKDEIFDVESVVEGYRKDVIEDFIKATLMLRGGANLSRTLADTSPVMSLIAITDSVRIPVNETPGSVFDFFRKNFKDGRLYAYTSDGEEIDGFETFDSAEELAKEIAEVVGNEGV